MVLPAYAKKELWDAEKGAQLRSRSFIRLNVLVQYASAVKRPAALLDRFFEHPMCASIPFGLNFRQRESSNEHS